jgi:hypothetical protein
MDYLTYLTTAIGWFRTVADGTTLERGLLLGGAALVLVWFAGRRLLRSRPPTAIASDLLKLMDASRPTGTTTIEGGHHLKYTGAVIETQRHRAWRYGKLFKRQCLVAAKTFAGSDLVDLMPQLSKSDKQQVRDKVLAVVARYAEEDRKAQAELAAELLRSHVAGGKRFDVHHHAPLTNTPSGVAIERMSLPPEDVPTPVQHSNPRSDALGPTQYPTPAQKPAKNACEKKG